MSEKIKYEIELQPFAVPGFVLFKQPTAIEQENVCITGKISITELSDELLEKLCAEFRNAVFAKKKADK